VLLATGCKLQNAAAGGGRHQAHGRSHSHSKSGHHQAHPKHHAQSGPAAPVRLITEPGGGFSPVYRLIRGARQRIDMTMYELADTTAEHDLAAAARRGVRVRVVLDQRERSTNSAAYRYLTDHHVKVAWSSTRFEYTHQKTVLIDHAAAVIMTANLTQKYYATSRDFLVIDRSPADISAVGRVFSADFAGRAIRPGDGRDLVWSPTDSQRQLLALIAGARHSLRIYSEEMGDSTVVDALVKAAHRGVSVRVCGENTDGEYDSEFAELARAGVRVSSFSSSSGFYIHGKVVEADYGTGRARMFVGSENFSSTSLNRNRELGLILRRHAAMASAAATFARDFRRGKHWARS
jgi:phosphatidylserine/phosphatidylglycerophosphate/cardiolipin synthase-like enzyme